MAEIEDAVFHCMRRAMQEHAARWQSALTGLTKPQYAVLTVLEADGPVDQATVGERAAIDKATLAGLVPRLEQRGLIVREVGSDRRKRLLRLTERGAAELATARPAADAVDDAILERLEPEERAHLGALLRKLTAL